MSGTVSRQEGDQYPEVSLLATELREQVADQLHDLVVEREAFGTFGELGEAVRLVGQSWRKVLEARGRQVQAEGLGLPVAKAVADEREALALTRQVVMSLGAVCGSLVVRLDFDQNRPVERPTRSEQNGDSEL